MRKKLPFIILAVIIFVQICVPVGLITYHKIDSKLAETKGEIFRFYIDDLMYDNGMLKFNVDTKNWSPDVIYANIKVDKEGYAVLNLTEKKPEGNYYIRSLYNDSFYFPVSYVTTEDYTYLHPRSLHKNYFDYYTPTGLDYYYNEAYLEAYVYKGRVGKPTVYIDGLDAEAYFSMLNEKAKAQ